MGANHVLSGERLAISNVSGMNWPVQPSLVSELFSDPGALRPRFENDVVLTGMVDHLEAEIIIRPHFEHWLTVNL